MLAAVAVVAGAACWLIAPAASAAVQTATFAGGTPVVSSPDGQGLQLNGDTVQATVDNSAGQLTFVFGGLPATALPGDQIVVWATDPGACWWAGDGVKTGDTFVALTDAAASGATNAPATGASNVPASGATAGPWSVLAAVQQGQGQGYVEQAPQAAISSDGSTVTVTVTDPALDGATFACMGVSEGWSPGASLFSAVAFSGYTAPLLQPWQETSPPGATDTLFGFIQPTMPEAALPPAIVAPTAPVSTTTPQTGPTNDATQPTTPTTTTVPTSITPDAAAHARLTSPTRLTAATTTVAWRVSCASQCTGRTAYTASVRSRGHTDAIPRLDATARSFSLAAHASAMRFSQAYNGAQQSELQRLVSEHGRVRLDLYATVTSAGHSTTTHRVLYIVGRAPSR